ncbi:riboflavin synthase [Rossellomorea aquimaris]|jgi:riboflavin synthase|uniref:Riboflavin synthase n=1 Tax=Rossellomorea aquimaris TaxID=189382 RepID=A0A5D4UWB7_9BACI|nr:riboflavin synthase [Rossellomorea aquimaris]TYS75159.1 riboflavin synthase [Rossellomorea aquimaris]TYS79536.1 riboflavin synthase [Rossellomorea aquimaris]TYS91773.1 riboflavin synthase [Rossellomorea aquimaris]
MFTGIIEEIGSIERMQKSSSSMELTITAGRVLEDVHIGDSISVNGVCLTVTSFSSRQFQVDVMPETFEGTTLRNLSHGSKVNLERAMAANGRFGGHFVNGHVDGVGTIVRIEKVENAWYMDISIPENQSHLFIMKGSVAIDGTSLTVFGVKSNAITISLIPQTRGDTVLGEKKVGDRVNIECDVMAKYFHRFYEAKEQSKSNSSRISYDFLSQNGFAD